MNSLHLSDGAKKWLDNIVALDRMFIKGEELTLEEKWLQAEQNLEFNGDEDYGDCKYLNELEGAGLIRTASDSYVVKELTTEGKEVYREIIREEKWDELNQKFIERLDLLKRETEENRKIISKLGETINKILIAVIAGVLVAIITAWLKL
jgi:hypothetical protein